MRREAVFKRLLNNEKLFLVGSVAAEERIRLPLRTGAGIGRFKKQAARKLLVAGSSLEINGLVHVVRRRVVAVGEPVLEDFLLGCAEFEAHIDFGRGNALLDEAVLIEIGRASCRERV